MANYPSPCEKCERRNNCTRFRNCQPWLKRYRYRQKQINGYAKKVLPGMSKTAGRGKDQSPCLTCTRVKDPRNCRKEKVCKAWREWFLGRWKLINGYYEKHRDKE